MRIDNPNSIGISTGFGIPTGGTTNQILLKSATTNYDTSWVNYIPTGGTANQVLIKNTSTNYDTSWSSVGRQDISYISTGQQGGIIMVADGKIYAIKSNNGGNVFYAGANWPTSYSEGNRNGVPNMTEISISGETGTLVDCKANGAGAYALFTTGNLYTWGYNAYGWCGVGSTSNVYYPTLASTGVTAVYTHPTNNSGEAVYSRLVIKKTDGKIYATGFNQNYEMGLGNATDKSSFTELTWAGTNPISVWNIGAWGGAIIVQKTDGTLIMSGYNNTGQLGLGNTTTQSIATAASSNAWLNSDTTYRIEEITFFGRWFNSAWQLVYNAMGILLRNGSGTRYVVSGNNQYGQIGDGTIIAKTVPTAPTGTWNTISQIAQKGGGYGSSYILKADGTLWSWGGNESGQLGNGNQTQQNTPGQRLTGVTNIFKGMPSTWLYSYLMGSPVFEKSDGYYICGLNSNGETGTGLINPALNTIISPVLTFTRINLPYSTRLKYLGQTSTSNQTNTNFAITTDNQMWAWGYNGYAMIESTGANAWQPLKYLPSILMR